MKGLRVVITELLEDPEDIADTPPRKGLTICHEVEDALLIEVSLND